MSVLAVSLYFRQAFYFPRLLPVNVPSFHSNKFAECVIIYSRLLLDSSAQLNMRGVFLHVVGDALGSVIVVISAAVIKYGEGDWKYKVDPIMR